jgi:hypothetical protein
LHGDWVLEWLDPYHRSSKFLSAYFLAWLKESPNQGQQNESKNDKVNATIADDDKQSPLSDEEARNAATRLSSFFTHLSKNPEWTIHRGQGVSRSQLERSGMPSDLDPSFSGREVALSREGRMMYPLWGKTHVQTVWAKISKTCWHPWAAFVIDLEERLTIHCYAPGVVDHASIVRGGPVALAGVVKTWMGLAEAWVVYSPQYGIGLGAEEDNGSDDGNDSSNPPPKRNLLEKIGSWFSNIIDKIRNGGGKDGTTSFMNTKSQLIKYLNKRGIFPGHVRVGQGIGLPWETQFKELMREGMVERQGDAQVRRVLRLPARPSRREYLLLLDRLIAGVA